MLSAIASMVKIGALVSGLLAVLGLSAWSVNHDHGAANTSQPIEIKWLIAHEPVSLFDRAVQDFATEFNTNGDGTVHITVLGPSDEGSTNGHLGTATVLKALDVGDVHMATVVVGALASSTVPELQVMNLPYLFKDYSSAERVFDSAPGAQMLSYIDAHTNEKGLAFTFSGGFMVIESNTKRMTTADDLAGLRIGSIDGPIAEASLNAFGAHAVSIDAHNGQKAIAESLDQYDGMETPYTRIFPETGQHPKYVAETLHGLFTTAIVVNKTFYDSLSAKNQVALQKAAQIAAQDERADSIALAQKHKDELVASGTRVTAFSSSSVAQLREDAQPLYDRYGAVFGTDLLHSIEALQ